MSEELVAIFVIVIPTLLAHWYLRTGSESTSPRQLSPRQERRESLRPSCSSFEEAQRSLKTPEDPTIVVKKVKTSLGDTWEARVQFASGYVATYRRDMQGRVAWQRRWLTNSGEAAVPGLARLIQAQINHVYTVDEVKALYQDA